MKIFRIQFILLFVLMNAFSVSLAADLCDVQKVVDGDTLEVSCENYKGIVGLQGIDAPEMGQPFGPELTEYLHQLVHGEQLILFKFDKSSKKGVLLFQGGMNVNARLVDNGYAWAVDRSDSKNNYLLKYEEAAHQAQKGIWSSSAYNQPPWEYRRLNHIVDDEK